LEDQADLEDQEVFQAEVLADRARAQAAHLVSVAEVSEAAASVEDLADGAVPAAEVREDGPGRIKREDNNVRASDVSSETDARRAAYAVNSHSR